MAKKTHGNLTEAFKALRRYGFIAKQRFMCCQSCGCAAIAEMPTVKKSNGYVFYHKQDDAHRIAGQPFYLSWGGDTNAAKIIIEILQQNGINVEWDGDESKRMKVLCTVNA